MASYDFPDSTEMFGELFGRSTATTTVKLTANNSVNIVLREHLSRLTTLLSMVGGILTIGLISGGLIVVYMTKQRASGKRLRTALDQAQQANEAKSIFLANMSHEVRTPLNGVLGMAELLLTRTQLDETQRRFAEQIKSSGTTLLAILNDILDISKLESGQLSIDPIRTNLPELMS
ncbi:histidine kinase dimerization/phospho-acceptor domain-containing protein [Consotaella aegiceratis]|uniref:histidine kinase dimerization/phospho-acceptor domain-containing protein n=1 Tax=Consotaella aegiceratis TaxID=3097961 RepID=UPI002F40D348